MIYFRNIFSSCPGKFVYERRGIERTCCKSLTNFGYCFSTHWFPNCNNQLFSVHRQSQNIHDTEFDPSGAFPYSVSDIFAAHFRSGWCVELYARSRFIISNRHNIYAGVFHPEIQKETKFCIHINLVKYVR